MKRRTKASRERDEKEALRKRLTDLAQGAVGPYCLPDGDEHGGMAAEMGIDAFVRWVGAIQRTLGSDDNKLGELWMLENYDEVGKAVEYLWNRGVRA